MLGPCPTRCGQSVGWMWSTSEGTWRTRRGASGMARWGSVAGSTTASHRVSRQAKERWLGRHVMHHVRRGVSEGGFVRPRVHRVRQAAGTLGTRSGRRRVRAAPAEEDDGVTPGIPSGSKGGHGRTLGDGKGAANVVPHGYKGTSIGARVLDEEDQPVGAKVALLRARRASLSLIVAEPSVRLDHHAATGDARELICGA